jgi:hypothetical protein
MIPTDVGYHPVHPKETGNDIVAAGPVVAPVASRKMQILEVISPEGRDIKPNFGR